MCINKGNKPSDKPHTEKCTRIRKTTENEDASEGNQLVGVSGCCSSHLCL